MEDDSLTRGLHGVVCSLVGRPDGSVRIAFDDATSSTDQVPQAWHVRTLFTWKDYADGALIEQLTDEQLADIGLVLISRLVALKGDGS